MSVTTQKKAVVKKVTVTTYESIQRGLKDTAKIEEKQLQQSIKSNLKSLKTKIEKTKEQLEEAELSRESALESSSVNWSALMEADANIESLEMGLQILKNYRDQYFPQWETILVQD